eukprot:5471397-Prymnesium_polylepis.2
MVLGVAGSELAFDIVSADRRGNRQLFGGEPWRVSLTGPMPRPEPVDVSVTDRGDGSYRCVYVPRVAGEYILSATLRGVHIRRSPLRTTVAPTRVHPPSCVAEGEGLHSAKRGRAAHFVVEARDAFGNACTGIHSFTVRVRPPLSSARSPEIAISKHADGTAMCEWLPHDAGRHHIGVWLAGIAIGGSEFVCSVAL